MKFIGINVILIGILLLFPLKVWARIGVGVGTGKIVIDEKLKPGTIYRLPQISVINTGDESGTYEVGVTYHQGQSQLLPQESWFAFSPKTFYLEPNQPQQVELVLSVPLKATPGDYFAYLEGHPVKKMILVQLP